MDVEIARWLVSDDAAAARDLAASVTDPGSLTAAEKLRKSVAPERAAAVLALEGLRRAAGSKAGEAAGSLWWTRTGLEQATRPAVASRRAARFARFGATAVLDLCCGLGLDTRAFVANGLAVTAIERDEVTAIFAAANVGPRADVVCGDAVPLAASLLDDEMSVFCDPARRSSAGRSWRVEDLMPSWDFVSGFLDGRRLACVKLGPGFPHRLIPDHVEAEWVSVGGSVVEAALWAGPGQRPGIRRAVVDGEELESADRLIEPCAGELGRYVYEPDGAVIRACLVPLVADQIEGHRIDDNVAYLTSHRAVTTPFATCFEVLDVLPWREKSVRAWVKENQVGCLEIKKRGLDVDPSGLRKKLKPSGPASATLILTPTPAGAVVLVARRVPSDELEPLRSVRLLQP